MTTQRPAYWLPYQAAIISDDAPIVATFKSRRVGVTHALAYRVAKERLVDGRHHDCTYSSTDELEAKRFVQDVVQHVRRLNRAVEMVVRESVIDSTDLKILSVEFPPVRTPSGDIRRPTLYAVSSSPDAFRGKGGDVIWDEADFHENQEEMWAAMTPVTARGGRLFVNTTRCHDASFVMDVIMGAGQRRRDGAPKPHDPPVSLHTVFVEDAIAQGIVENINRVSGTAYTREGWLAEQRAKAANQLVWRREFYGEKTGEADSYFPYSLLRPRVVAGVVTRSCAEAMLADVRAAMETIGDASAVTAGCDVGIEDRFVIRVRARVGGMNRLVGSMELHRADFSLMEGSIRTLMVAALPGTHLSARKVRRLLIDKSGMGMQLAMEMEHAFRGRCEGIVFTNGNKDVMATGVRRHLEEATCDLEDDTITLSQYNAIRQTRTLTGKPRFDGESNEHGHCDRFWADAMCLYAADMTKSIARAVEVNW